MVKGFIERAVGVWVILAALLIGLATVGCAGWLIWRSEIVIIMLLVAILLALMLNPLVERLASLVRFRWLSIILIYVAIAAILAVLSILIIPRLIEQGKALYEWIRDSQNPIRLQVANWSQMYQEGVPPEVQAAVGRNLEQVYRSSEGVVHSLFNTILDCISWTFRGLIIMVISIYLLLDKDRLVAWFRNVIPPGHRIRLQRLFNDMMEVLRNYIRGLTIMVIFVAMAVSLLLMAVHNPYWLFIGCLAGLLEVIPYFGPVAGALPAVTMGFIERGPATGIGLIIAFVIINQIEGHVVAPVAMGHSMDLRPLTVLVALLVGAEVKGIIGMILAVPVVGIGRVLWVHTLRYFREPLTPDGQTLLSVAGEAMDIRCEDPRSNGSMGPLTH